MKRAVIACEEECRRPLDLLLGPVLRLTLYRLSANEHVLLMTVHHIVFDGWSLGIFLKELVSLFAAFSAGRPSPLPGLPIRHSDFALSQRQELEGEVLEKLLAFWRKNLEGIPPHLALPFDHPLRSGRNYRGARHSLVLGEELTRSLKDRSRDEGATLYMALLAGLAALLYRYTGQSDVLIGAPTASRMSAKGRALIGNFVNTLVLRTSVSDGLTFRELIARARRTALDAFAHQDLPFNVLVSELNPERDSTGSSLVQVMLTLQNSPRPAVEIPGLKFELLDIYTGRALYDLAIEFQERAGRLVWVGSTTTATCSRPGRSPGWRAISGRSSKRRWLTPISPLPRSRCFQRTTGARSSRRGTQARSKVPTTRACTSSSNSRPRGTPDAVAVCPCGESSRSATPS